MVDIEKQGVLVNWKLQFKVYIMGFFFIDSFVEKFNLNECVYKEDKMLYVLVVCCKWSLCKIKLIYFLLQIIYIIYKKKKLEL